MLNKKIYTTIISLLLLVSAQALAMNDSLPDEYKSIRGDLGTPFVDSVDVKYKPNMWAESMTVSGENFSELSFVMIDGKRITNFQSLSDSGVSFRLPADLKPGSYSLEFFFDARSERNSYLVKTLSIGNKGPQGPQGIQGIQGVQGEMGPRGYTGERGPRGYTGEKGETGEKGDPGVDPDVITSLQEKMNVLEDRIKALEDSQK